MGREVVRIYKKGRRRGRGLIGWIQLIVYGVVLLFIIGYIVRIFLVDAAAPVVAVYLPLIAR